MYGYVSATIMREEGESLHLVFALVSHVLSTITPWMR